MYAVIETGGKQYRVTPGETVRVETLSGEIGSEVELGKVIAIMTDGDELKLGSAVSSAKVRGSIVAHDRADKVLVFKFKRKKQYKRTIGHRQNYTELTIGDIVV